ncbi:MAG: hypothetical protein RL173_1546 [Fibrobacterota bacterium]|jgi:TolB-like protein
MKGTMGAYSIMKTIPIWILAILVADSFAAGNLPTMAVLPFRSRGVDSASTRLLEDSLHARLVKAGGMRVLMMDYTRWKTPEACDGMECAVRLGRQLGVQRAVIVGVQMLNSSLLLDAKLVDVESGIVLSRSGRSMSGKVGLVAAAITQNVASDLAQGVKVNDPQDPPAPHVPLDQKADSRFWVNAGWVGAGAVVVSGCAAAAYLFIDALPASKSSPPPPDGGGDPKKSDGSVVFRWD